MLAVAILAFVGFLFINSAADLFRAKELRVEDIFWQGVTSARQLALETNQVVTLRYDQEKRVLVWMAGPGTSNTLPYPGKKLDFLPATQQGMVLIGGQLTETTEITRVRFYPDGGCDSFRAQLTDAADRRTVLLLDPWTCAPMLTAAAPQ